MPGSSGAIRCRTASIGSRRLTLETLVLGHPGYKHLLRLCVHPDGKVEAWTIGKDDTLGKERPALIDRFEW